MKQSRLIAPLLLAALAVASPATAAPAEATKPMSTVSTPEWAKDAVFYQIFPERFANGDRRNDPPGVRPWGSTPETENYMGGDLDGVIQHLDYLKDLGVTAIYFNPIFSSDSNHKYRTTDYMHVDPAFGGDAAFRRMIKAAHAHGIKVVLDGVFNHTSDNHPFFLDAVKNGEKSRYWKWYQFNGYPVTKDPKPNYEAWWGISSLPKLQVAKNPEVANYIYAVEEHWLREGIDGWRLDVPNEIDSDAFWRGFRARAKAINPDAYIVGEIWTPAERWLQGDQFDAVMNYAWRDPMLKFFATRSIDAQALDASLKTLRERYHPEITNAMFNLLDSHDTPRFLTDAGGEVSRLELAVAFQMTYPGAPVIYYGDEIGMQGGKDPDCRRCFDWNPAHQNLGLRHFYQRLIALRKAHPALRAGTFETLLADKDVYAYARAHGGDHVVVVLNNGPTLRDIQVPAGSLPQGSTWQDALGGATAHVQHGTLAVHLDPMQALILLPGRD